MGWGGAWWDVVRWDGVGWGGVGWAVVGCIVVRCHLEAWHLGKAAQLLPGSLLQPVCGRVGEAAGITQAASQQEGPVLRVHKPLQAGS